MCGITGYIAFSEQAASRLHAMTEIIHHRGPDDEGFATFKSSGSEIKLFGGRDTPPAAYKSDLAYAPQCTIEQHEQAAFLVGLGHRRLAIVDVSPAGHQPMCTADQRYWIVFNGEVYNHVELRVELEPLGHRFISHSDTEVILAAYQEWGKACLTRFNGMFAFLIYDRQENKLFAARDRFGVKPLYYWISKEGIGFGSEIKQFTVLPGWQARLNGQRAYDFLNWSITDHTDETLFDGVFQLRGGQALELTLSDTSTFVTLVGKRLPVFDWYKLVPEPFEGGFDQAANGLRERLRDSVRLRLRADVPVGSCLSGGLDSSSIVVLMTQLLGEQNANSQQKTFSACANLKRFDEREYIDEVVHRTGVDAHYVYPRLEDLFATQEQITWHQDEPYASSSIYAQWHVFKLASENGVKVMLDGQGADEQLAGYHNFFAPHFANLFKRGRWIRLYREIRAVKRIHGYSNVNAVKRIANLLLPEGLRQVLRAHSGKSTAKPEWLSLDKLGAEAVDPFAKIGGKASSIRELSFSQVTSANLQMLLHWEDRDSMAHSIESRVPFLDYRLVEYVLGLPDEFKLLGGVTKRVLREGMCDLLPERVTNRMDKMAFVTPEEDWMRHGAATEFRVALIDAIEISGGIINQKALEILDGMIEGKRPFDYRVWRMISFGIWIRKFNVTVA